MTVSQKKQGEIKRNLDKLSKTFNKFNTDLGKVMVFSDNLAQSLRETNLRGDSVNLFSLFFQDMSRKMSEARSLLVKIKKEIAENKL